MWKCLNRKRNKWQGVVEYAGALIIAGLTVVFLANGAASGNWLNTAVLNLLQSAWDLLVSYAAGIK